MFSEADEIPAIYLIGDSISVHYGTYLESCLPKNLNLTRRSGDQEALTNLDIPKGSNSGDSAAVLEFVRARFSGGAFLPRYVLWNCGLHDIKRSRKTEELQVPLEAYGQNLTEIVTILQTSGVQPLWIRITPVDDEIHNQRNPVDFFRFAADCDAYNALADQVMRERGVPMIDLNGFTRQLGGGDALYCDHVHFHGEISRLQGAYLAGWIAAYAESIL